ncbi:hypothetical protein AAFF_G00370060, partial [Aldrovandia affinis]
MDQITEITFIEMQWSGYDFWINDTNTTDSPVSGIFLINECGIDLHSFRRVFQPVVYSMLLAAGLGGNGLLLAVLQSRLGRLGATEIYLLHLALADLLLLLTFPFALGEAFVGWVFGDFLCRVLGLLNVLSFLCGSLLLVCIGFDRYLAVVRAVQSVRGRRTRAVHLTCAAVWLLGLCLSAPNAVFLSVGVERDRGLLQCSSFSHGLHGNNWNLARRFITHLCFFLPLGLMGYCYSAVIAALRRGQHSRERRGAVRLAVLLTAVFCLFWLPYNLAVLAKTLLVLGALPQTCRALELLDHAVVVTESIGYSHCCINPLL